MHGSKNSGNIEPLILIPDHVKWCRVIVQIRKMQKSQ